MTIIAWDGKTLAADKAASNCGYLRTVTKIYRVPSGLVGFAGDGCRALALLQWFREGCDPAKYPAFQASDDAVVCLHIGLDGRSYAYASTPFPMPYEDKFDAIGSGRDYALAAMFLGHSAIEAVEVAIALDNSCGNGIDTLELTTTTEGRP